MYIYEEERPWGNFRRFTHNEVSTVKILTIKKGGALSLQYHNDRDEFWRILSGSPDVVIGEKTETAHAGDEFFITRGSEHRILAHEDDVTVLEVALGDFNEDDIVRIEDDYNRV